MDADAEARVRQSFARQAYMETLGAELVHVDEGEVDIALPFSERLVQQDGFLHAGVVAGATDSACGYAALTCMDPDRLPWRRRHRQRGPREARGDDDGNPDRGHATRHCVAAHPHQLPRLRPAFWNVT